jgi:cytosine permease
MATIALFAGTFLGYLTQYVHSFGLPAVQSLIAAGLVYFVAMKIKAKVAPDRFTEGMNDQDFDVEGKNVKTV